MAGGKQQPAGSFFSGENTGDDIREDGGKGIEDDGGAEPVSVCIVAPSPVPFVVGGAEKLWWGLQEYINKNTPHHCELIKMSVREDTFLRLAESYAGFYGLDLSHFDRVLTTRYPAWMVRHPDHRVYFQHPMRGLYERYQGPEALPRSVCAHPRVKRVLRAAAGPDSRRLPDARYLLDACMALACDPAAPEEALALPGPLARAVVWALDRRALERAASVSAISAAVRDRRGYFPDPRRVPVIYHPSNLQGLHGNGRDYFFTASRMVGAKRIPLILDAYARSGLDVPLRIAGHGPELAKLREKARGNPRIRFTGFVSDTGLVDLYAGALAVVFVPENEDMGLVAVEAMQAGKPVITCADAGGPAELVEHEKTGWVCAPDAPGVARAMQDAAGNREKAGIMGRRARRAVRAVTWKNVFQALLGPPVRAGASRRRPPIGVRAIRPGPPPSS